MNGNFFPSIANHHKRRISLNLQEVLKPFRCHLEHIHSRLPGRRWFNRCFSQNREVIFFFFFFLVRRCLFGSNVFCYFALFFATQSLLLTALFTNSPIINPGSTDPLFLENGRNSPIPLIPPNHSKPIIIGSAAPQAARLGSHIIHMRLHEPDVENFFLPFDARRFYFCVPFHIIGQIGRFLKTISIWLLCRLLWFPVEIL